MPDEQTSPSDGDIRSQVLARATAQLSESNAVPEQLLTELKLALADERPPKAAAVVELIEKHFKGSAS